jgi:hypothetical protein
MVLSVDEVDDGRSDRTLKGIHLSFVALAATRCVDPSLRSPDHRSFHVAMSLGFLLRLLRLLVDDQVHIAKDLVEYFILATPPTAVLLLSSTFTSSFLRRYGRSDL